jgi:RNA polymerase sigma-70 factor (ECF subfamily)
LTIAREGAQNPRVDAERTLPPDTVTLLERWNTGDEEALGLLVDRYLPRVRRLVQLRMGQRLRQKAESGDVVQDAMLQFLRYSPRFQVSSGRQFAALVQRIVENVLRDRHDWYARRRREMDRECPLPASSVLQLTSSRTGPAPSEVALRHERQALVRLGLDLLRPADREVIVLREYDGLSFEEISAQLGIAEAAVRMRLSRALTRLGRNMRALLRNDRD